MSPRSIAAALLLVTGCVEGAPPVGSYQATNQENAVASPIVVELFTSQGCSSCPPADALLARLQKDHAAARRPLLCLSFHVDYWNRLGWTDPYSSAVSTDRQRRYAAAMQSNQVYTPQMIVSGVEAFVGSNRQLAAAAIEAQTASEPTAFVTLRSSAGPGADQFNAAYEVRGDYEGCHLNIAAVQPHAGNQALAGENSGRELEHLNVVRWFRSIPLQEGSAAGTVSIDLPAGSPQDLRVVAYVQESQTMKIVGAATVQ